MVACEGDANYTDNSMEAKNVQMVVKPKKFWKNEMGMLNLVTSVEPESATSLSNLDPPI